MKPTRTYHADPRDYATLLEALGARAQTEDAGMTYVALDGQETQMSWGALWRASRRRATWLAQTTGLGPIETVGLALPNDHRFAECLFGAWMLGALPVTLARPGVFGGTSTARVRHILQDSGVTLLLCAAEELEDFADLGDHVRVVGITHDALTTPELDELVPCDPERPALLQYTSGSTSRPRGVTLSHGNLAANTYAATSEYDFQENESMVSWLPFYHDMGLIAELLIAIRRGLPFFVMEPWTFLQDPGVWLDTIDRHRCTITHIPNLALAHCMRRTPDARLQTLDLSCLNGVFVGSEPIDTALVSSFLDRFAPTGFNPGALGGAYGLAESVVAVSRTDPGHGLPVDHVERAALTQGHARPALPGPDAVAVATVGRPIDGHAVEIRDASGIPCPDRVVGELWVQGPSVMLGYWGQQEATEAVIIEGRRGRWLKTGDLGYLAEGSLYVCGRAKELIIVRGSKYHPEDLERAAERVPGVRGGQSMAFSVPEPDGAPEAVVMVCEVTREESGLEEKIRGEVLERTGVKLTHVELRPPNTLPRTTSGKRQRRLVRSLWLGARS